MSDDIDTFVAEARQEIGQWNDTDEPWNACVLLGRALLVIARFRTEPADRADAQLEEKATAINCTESVRAEREVIIAKLNQFMANAVDLGHRDEALAFETARNWLIRRQLGER